MSTETTTARPAYEDDGYYDDPRDDFEDDGTDAGEECGRWTNGRLTPYCRKAGSEECDWECPYRSSLR